MAQHQVSGKRCSPPAVRFNQDEAMLIETVKQVINNLKGPMGGHHTRLHLLYHMVLVLLLMLNDTIDVKTLSHNYVKKADGHLKQTISRSDRRPDRRSTTSHRMQPVFVKMVT